MQRLIALYNFGGISAERLESIAFLENTEAGCLKNIIIYGQDGKARLKKQIFYKTYADFIQGEKDFPL